MTDKKKVFIASAIIIVIAIVLIGMGLSTHNKSKATASESMTVEDVVAYQKTCGDMQQQLGNDSIYPLYYVSATNKKQMKNLKGTSASDDTEDGIVEFLALEWYADNHGMAVNEGDVEKRIQKTIDELKPTDNYNEYDNAAKDLGTTFEQIIRNDYKTYYFDEIQNRVYTYESKIYSKKNGGKNDGFSKYWDTFTSDVTADYKDSQSYEEMRPVLEKCHELAEKNVTAISTIKKAGV